MKDNSLRKSYILQHLPLQLPGLEISPLFRPATDKALHNVCYTDYTSAEESRQKHAHYEHDEIVDIDFICHPHATLQSCVPDQQQFDWSVASHVLEHVPDPLGWILEVLAVLNDGAVFSLVLPNKRYCFDRFRQTSSAAQWLQWWLTRQRIPAPQQLYDFLRHCTSDDGEMYERLKDLSPEAYQQTRCPHYAQQQALEFVLNAWTTGHYFDAHCSVFTPESAAALMAEVVELGILNVAVSAPQQYEDEFYIRLTKLGEPALSHPGPGASSSPP
ncbi:methyltransferase domain-containing protein [Candidatus Sodalis endolongispinus]|uniref:Methyltransferase domain-containing protein n=1 Tax=Candidatus Sodalis endolongispinus TaxID=2812662 RepID=A0ABS5YEA7_9GAMM|nr:class I SAM-dependent methyltransferase [Candidatus Sodalis endolongispinus]MBT9433390.1 methyltransferase domain-containing protein [Candidatus Sodalis endolongispinus]